MYTNQQILEMMNIKLKLDTLPSYPNLNEQRRAPKRTLRTELSLEEKRLALKNVLRYLPERYHEQLIPEFLEELETRGRIYAYRFRPNVNLYGKPIDEYKGIPEARAMQVMIDNNLDPSVALYPYELVTYGESGQIFQNWLQYQLVKKYLENMTNNQTLVVSSGHPVGLFRSSESAPRVIITNGLLVGKWDDPENFSRLAALGVSNYGQMTAGGWMYIGSQGIVHGTFITVLNAGRKYLGLSNNQNLKGKCFISSGLGGMSGAQPKAIEIAGGVAVIAEVDETRIKKCKDKNWIQTSSHDLSEIGSLIKKYKQEEKPFSVAYHGNIVDLLEYIDNNNIQVELISDQTSCHDYDKGGYIPVTLDLNASRKMLSTNKAAFMEEVRNSLKRHFSVIKRLTANKPYKGAHFWDYGNSFMSAIFDSGITEIAKNGVNTDDGFIFPSYVEDIMGPLCFDRGFGPFRWVCLSGKKSDLKITDEIATSCINPELSAMHYDNHQWIKHAADYGLIMGTQARILYANEEDRIKIALAFNKAIADGKIGPVMMGRDHHDVSGTDSPYRETANIYDGSRTTADMSIQCFAGNVARGMTMVVLSNGGGVGIGKASNGGNGIFLDGSCKAANIIKAGLSWDVMSGVARRSWAGNKNAIETAVQWNSSNTSGQITIPFQVKKGLIEKYI